MPPFIGMAGKAFFDGEGFYGGSLTIKLGDINAVNDVPVEALLASLEDKQADAREDAIDA